MATLTINITDTQLKCMEYISPTALEWVQTAMDGRAIIAQEDIIAKLVAHCNANEIPIATGADAQITQAYSLQVVDTITNVQSSMAIV